MRPGCAGARAPMRLKRAPENTLRQPARSRPARGRNPKQDAAVRMLRAPRERRRDGSGAFLRELLQQRAQLRERQADDVEVVAVDALHELPGQALDAIRPRLVE